MLVYGLCNFLDLKEFVFNDTWETSLLTTNLLSCVLSEEVFISVSALKHGLEYSALDWNVFPLSSLNTSALSCLHAF